MKTPQHLRLYVKALIWHSIFQVLGFSGEGISVLVAREPRVWEVSHLDKYIMVIFSMASRANHTRPWVYVCVRV